MEKEIPDSWVEIELGNILKLKNGYAFKSDDFKDTGIPVIRISNIQNELVQTENAARVDQSKIKQEFVVQQGDILIAMSGATTGKYGIYNEEVVAMQNQRVGNLIPHDESLTSRKFILYLLGGLKKEIEEKAYGGAQPNISPKLIEEIRIGLPPLPVQQRIVAKLDTLFGHLDALKTRLDRIPQMLKDFRQKVLTQAVTGKLTEEWREGRELESGLNVILQNRLKYYNEKVRIAKKGNESKPKKLDVSGFEYFNYEDNYAIPSNWEIANLKNIADLITDGEHLTPRRTKEGKYLLSARNVQNGYISLEKVDYVPNDEYERIRKRCNPEFNDVLISCSGTIGRVSIVPKDLEFVMVRSAALVKLQSNIKSSKYIEFALRSSFAQEQMLTLQKSTAQANLFIGPIGQIVLPIASIKEQREIVRRVESLFAKADQIEASYQKLKAKIEQLPQSLLAKAFRGELVAQLFTDGNARDLLEQIKHAKAGLEKGGKGKKLKVDDVLNVAAEPRGKYGKKII